ncbi:MAG TPA: hypothetical protein DEO60_04340 [Bacteroidales bacterium]|nr:hypothetical protein [Bacteroidales bacterium]
MKNSLFYIFVISLLVLSSCKKDEAPATSGTATIDNTTTLGQTYYVYGFLFSEARKVATLNDPVDVLTISPEVNVNNEIVRITFNVNTFKECFFLYGEYQDAASASSAFASLTSFSNPLWIDPPVEVKEKQIWLFRNSQNKYAKIRVVKTVKEKRNNVPYAECTFQWEYQPDGTLTFPGK